MPPIKRRGNLSRRTRSNASQRRFRSNRTVEQTQERNEIERNRLSDTRSDFSPEERRTANQNDMFRMRHNRSTQTNRVSNNLRQRGRRRDNGIFDTHGAAFRYNSAIDYSGDQSVTIGSMSTVCPHCKAFKYRNETPGLCCANGKVKLSPLIPPPEPLRSLVSGYGAESKHFLKEIQNYNNCFQMTSFGATNVVRENFMPTFKVNNCFLYNLSKIWQTI